MVRQRPVWARGLANIHTVAILTKANIREDATLYAQGGGAAVLFDQDTIASHIHDIINDTINVGVELGNPEAIHFTVEHSEDSIAWLIELIE